MSTEHLEAAQLAIAELSRIRGLLSDRTSLVTIVQSVKGIGMTSAISF